MQYKKTDNLLFIRFDPGEEIITELKKVVSDLDIKSGSISAIGALNNVTIGFFDTSIKEYKSKVFESDYEIVSLIGSVSSMNEEPYLHLHICIGDNQFNTYGGHFDRGIVSATCEMIIVISNDSITRCKGDKFGLNLLRLN
jgi:hypothetical protein